MPLTDFVKHHFAVVFSLVFPVLWLAIGILFGAISGWYPLMARFPDRPSDPILRLYAQSGGVGPVSMRGILTLAVCREGLRVSVWRIFGPFSRPFLVPWGEIAVARGSIVFWPIATLQFGDPVVGSLVLSAPVADRLAYAAGHLWPEAGPFPETSLGARVRGGLKLWIMSLGIAGAVLGCFVSAVKTHQPLLVAALALGGLGMLVAVLVKRR